LALLAAAGLGIPGGASAQDPAPAYQAKATYGGDLGFNVNYIGLKVLCIAVGDAVPRSCSAEGTFTVNVSASAKRKLGISSTTVGTGVLKPCGGGTTCGRELKIPAAVKPKLQADFKKAQAKCGSCSTPLPVDGRITVALTGPAGLPTETLADSVKLGIGSGHAGGTSSDGAEVCTSNWVGSHPEVGAEPCSSGGGNGSDG
jgi:hypothetical protein